MLLMLWITSCGNKDKEFVHIFEVECIQFHFGINESKFLECSAFQMSIPLNWEIVIKHSGTDTTYVLTEKLDTTNNVELTDEEFDIKYNSFQTISLTFAEVYESLDYDVEFETVYQKIAKNEQNRIKESGISTFNNRKANWIIYEDDSYKNDNLKCESIMTCITNSKYYMWIIIQIFGEHESERRKCQAMGIIKTLKLKV